jgi:hypothetical protein
MFSTALAALTAVQQHRTQQREAALPFGSKTKHLPAGCPNDLKAALASCIPAEQVGAAPGRFRGLPVDPGIRRSARPPPGRPNSTGRCRPAAPTRRPDPAAPAVPAARSPDRSRGGRRRGPRARPPAVLTPAPRPRPRRSACAR